jgi:hypothetical protein
MKRIAVLLVLLLAAGLSLYGCGSKGSSSNDSSSTSNPGGGSQSGSNSTFTLNLVDNAARFVTAGTGSTTPPTDVRVVIRKFGEVGTLTQVCTLFSQVNFDQDGNALCDLYTQVTVTTFTEVYRDIQDVPYVTPIQVGIPAGTGYQLDVITSDRNAHPGIQTILKYGQLTNVAVPGTGSVGMHSVYDILNMKVADSITSKGTFNVTLNDVLPFAPTYKMTMTYNGTSVISPTVVTSGTNTTSFTAPTSYDAGATLSFQGQFTINRSFLNIGEKPENWTRLFPDTAYGETAFGNFNPLIHVVLPGI